MATLVWDLVDHAMTDDVSDIYWLINPWNETGVCIGQLWRDMILFENHHNLDV